jgi:hypothetical protein
MNPEAFKDLGATIAGGGAGVGLLLTVKWELVPYGEVVKIGVSLALIGLGYVMYRGKAAAA